jgi:hypothetical protein
VLQKNTRRVVGTDRRPTKHENLSVSGKFSQTLPDFGQRNVEGTLDALLCHFLGISHIQQKPIADGIPVCHRHIAPENIRAHHPCEINGILRTPKRRSVRELGFFQIVNGAFFLERHSE